MTSLSYLVATGTVGRCYAGRKNLLIGLFITVTAFARSPRNLNLNAYNHALSQGGCDGTSRT